MDTRTVPPATAPDLVATTTTARPTPRPVRVRFAEVLAGGARGIVRGAEAAMTALPGAPLVSTAIRGGAAPGERLAVGGGAMGAMGAPGTMAGVAVPGALGVGAGVGAGTSPAGIAEGPGGATSASGLGSMTAGEGTGVESSLQQAQEMNLYYLQIQEAVNAQNRTFSVLSNVLKAEHDTVKTAIGNIR